MFKEKIEHIVKSIIGNLEINSDFISFNELSDLQIDDYIINFIQAEIDWWIYEDRLLRNSNKSFDFSGMDSDSVNNEIDSIYKKHIKISVQELKQLISYAVKLRANFLIKPKNCLITFCYTNSTATSKKELELKLSYFIDYYYLINGIKQWVSQNNSENILKFNFEHKISDTENNEAKKLDGYGFFELIEPLWMFFENSENELPFEIISLFFEDKNMSELSAKIKSFAETNRKQNISKQDLQMFLSDIEPSGNYVPPTNIIADDNLAEEGTKEDKIDYVFIENPDELIEDIRKSLALLGSSADVNANQAVDKKVATHTEPISNEIQNLNADDSQKEAVDINKILDAEDGTELSADDIDALFNS